MNSKIVNVLSLLFLLSTVCVSCSDKTNVDSNDNEGVVSLVVEAEQPQIKVTKTVTDAVEVPLDDFSVAFYDINKTEPVSWFDKKSDMPDDGKVRLKFGTYKARAWYGTLYEAKFDAPFYQGWSDEFVIDTYTEKSVKVNCKLDNTVISVSYSELFKKKFSQFESYRVVGFIDGGYNALSYPLGESRKGYFKPGKIWLKLVVVKSGGEQISYGLSPIEDAKGGEHYKVFMDTENDPLLNIKVTIDETTKDVSKEELIEWGDIVKEKSKVLLSFNPETFNKFMVSVVDVSKQLLAYIKTPGGINKLQLHHNSKLLTDNGFASPIDFSTLQNDQQKSDLLKSLGVEWETNFSDDVATKAEQSRINLSQFIYNTSVDALLSFKIVAAGRDNVDIEKEFKFDIKEPLFEINQPDLSSGDVWSFRAYIPTYKVANQEDSGGATLNAEYQYLSSDGTWRNLDTYDYNVNRKRIKTNSNTTYNVRLYYERNGYKKTLWERAIKTEAATPLLNGNFDSWSTLEKKTKTYASVDNVNNTVTIERQNPLSWASSNAITTQLWTDDNITNHSVRNSVVYTTDANGGSGTAVMLKVVAHGSDNVFDRMESSYTIWPGREGWNTQTINTASAGMISTGTIVKNGGVIDKTKFHITHTAKPDGIEFYYKYDNRGTNASFIANIEVKAKDGTVIATASYVSATTYNDYKKVVLPLTYSDMSKEIGTVGFYMSSNNNLGSAVASNPVVKTTNWTYVRRDNCKGTFGIKWTEDFYSGYTSFAEGAVAFVDDVKLIYNDN